MQRPPPPHAAVFAGGDCGEAAAAAAVTAMSSAEAALPAVDGALVAQGPNSTPGADVANSRSDHGPAL